MRIAFWWQSVIVALGSVVCGCGEPFVASCTIPPFDAGPTPGCIEFLAGVDSNGASTACSNFTGTLSTMRCPTDQRVGRCHIVWTQEAMHGFDEMASYYSPAFTSSSARSACEAAAGAGKTVTFVEN